MLFVSDEKLMIAEWRMNESLGEEVCLIEKAELAVSHSRERSTKQEHPWRKLPVTFAFPIVNKDDESENVASDADVLRTILSHDFLSWNFPILSAISPNKRQPEDSTRCEP